jgi:hypothetical protein
MNRHLGKLLAAATATLLFVSCSEASQSTPEVATSAQVATTTSAPTTSTSASPESTLTTQVELDYDQGESAPYVQVLSDLESAEVVWPVSQDEAYSFALQLCTDISEIESIDDLSAFARTAWSGTEQPTQESWEDLQTLYSTVANSYCRKWWLPVTLIGDTPADAEVTYGLIERPDALAVLLTRQHPRAAALVLDHLAFTEYGTEQVTYLSENHPDQFQAIAIEYLILNPDSPLE